MTTKRAHLTLPVDDIRDGKLCTCPACTKDGQHEPDCAVHDEPIGKCTCDRADQAKGAG
jgi:hypothetical protein